MRAKEIMLRCSSLQEAENKRADPGKHQLTSDGSQRKQPGSCKQNLLFTAMSELLRVDIQLELV